MEQPYGEVLESGTIRFVRRLPGPVDRIWAYLTESDKRATWFAGGDIELRTGGKAKLLFKHSLITKEVPPDAYREMNENGIEGSETVLRCEPPRLLVISWSEPGAPPSEVTFELSTEGDHVVLVLTHRRIGNVASMANFGSGWHLHLDQLERVLEGRAKGLFWSRLDGLQADYARRAQI